MSENHDTANRVAHWDAAYGRTPDGFSWHQDQATTSLRLMDALAVPPSTPVVDIGGGASTLVDGLLERSFEDLTVLDLSPAGLRIARSRLGARADHVDWVTSDLLTWTPARRYGLWHDRAVLHFLTDPADRQRYVELAARTVTPGGHLILGVFAPDGPERCSGLPTIRSAPEDLGALLGPAFERITSERQVHHTPSGASQPFTWVTARRTTTPHPRTTPHP